MVTTTELESKPIDQPNRNQVSLDSSLSITQLFAERFNVALDRNNFPPLHFGRHREVSARFYVSRNGARKWVTGECMPDVEHLILICNELGTTVDFLLGRNTPHAANSTSISVSQDTDALPLLSGKPNSASADSESLGNITFENSVQQSAMRLPPNGSKLYLVATDSMQPVINVGDTVFLDMSATKLEDGGIYMFAARDRILVRRIVMGLDDQITLSASNKIYPDQKLSIDDIQIGETTNPEAKLRLIASIQWMIKKIGGM